MRKQESQPRDHVDLDVGKRRAVLRLGGELAARFDVRRRDVLARRDVETLLGEELAGSVEPVLVVFEQSSPDARSVLREHGISYAAADGELFVLAPPVYVERPAGRRVALPSGSLPAPFAARASRVPRWLLLHSDRRPSFRDLARELELSEAVVSRTMRALADDGLVTIEADSSDARRRLSRLRDTAALLDAFERASAARRQRRVTWDVGARDVSTALSMVRGASARLDRPYAVGGLAGAALVRRVVEPADVTLWIARDDFEAWAEELMATTARPGSGRIVAHLAPDPFVLTLADCRDDLQVADPVQLCLDCRVAGERALEAADAIRMEMGW
jgi:hypothetical protein